MGSSDTMARRMYVTWVQLLMVLGFVFPGSGAGDESAWFAPCGPVALKIVCELKGLECHLTELAQLAGTDVRGTTTLQGMADALSELGFAPVCAAADFEQLKKLPFRLFSIAIPRQYPIMPWSRAERRMGEE